MSDELPEYIVGVVPGAFVGVFHEGFVAALIVFQSRHLHAVAVGGGEQFSEDVVTVVNRPAGAVLNLGHFPYAVVKTGFGLTDFIGGNGAGGIVLDGADVAFWVNHLGGPTQ